MGPFTNLKTFEIPGKILQKAFDVTGNAFRVYITVCFLDFFMVMISFKIFLFIFKQ